MTKFTKGEWKVSTLYNTLLQVSANDVDICETDCNGDFDDKTGILKPTEEERANAHLIAAAPDMYNFIASLQLSVVEEVCEAEELLAKARGETWWV